MTIRTTTTKVQFASPFILGGHEEILPAGIYHVDVDEEVIEAIDRTIYRRVETRLRIQTIGRTVHRRIESADLEAAAASDRVATLDIADRHLEPDPNKPSTQMPEKRRVAVTPSSLLRAVRSWSHAILTNHGRSEL
ncbi:MAG: hypothetical protein EOP17_00415 [Rhizobiaceae bacterium]|nr:MAG: hypothetical protein EOP17_00415 [Rhizobiaceae bacterium]